MFDIHKFYEVIVEWSKETKTEEDKRLVEDLLLWWSRQVHQPFCIIVDANQKVQEGIQANICISD